MDPLHLGCSMDWRSCLGWRWINLESVQADSLQLYICIYKYRWWFQGFFMFTLILGEMIQFDEHIFQMGWNHQPDMICRWLRYIWHTCDVCENLAYSYDNGFDIADSTSKLGIKGLRIWGAWCFWCPRDFFNYLQQEVILTLSFVDFLALEIVCW